MFVFLCQLPLPSLLGTRGHSLHSRRSQGLENPKAVLGHEDLLNAVPIPNRRCASTKNNSAMLGLRIDAMFQRAHSRRIGLDSC